MLKRSFALLSLFAFFAVSAYADQAAYVEKSIATKAVAILKGVPRIAHLCEPCRETKPTLEDIKTVDMVQSDGLWSVRVNAKGIDLAYVFFPTQDGRFRNVGLEVKADVDGVSEYIKVELIPAQNPSGARTPQSQPQSSPRMNEIPRLRELASKAFDAQDYRTAAMHYTSIIAIDPNDAQAYVGRGASA